MPVPLETYGVRDAYLNVKTAAALGDLRSAELAAKIMTFTEVCLTFLNGQCDLIDLVSKVPGKKYVTYTRNNVVARAANRALFEPDPTTMVKLWTQWNYGQLSPDEMARFAYTSALAPCLAMELFDRQNKKGPATYFECLIGHVFAGLLQADARKRATMPIHGENVSLTMDFLYGDSDEKGVHLAVKMSTRERVVQAWAHQRLLNVAFGEGSYVGILAVCAETKLDSRNLEVVEICVPDQWLAYQVGLAEMRRIYYLDLPNRYKELSAKHPDVIHIRPMSDAFTEITPATMG